MRWNDKNELIFSKIIFLVSYSFSIVQHKVKSNMEQNDDFPFIKVYFTSGENLSFS